VSSDTTAARDRAAQRGEKSTHVHRSIALVKEADPPARQSGLEIGDLPRPKQRGVGWRGAFNRIENAVALGELEHATYGRHGDAGQRVEARKKAGIEIARGDHELLRRMVGRAAADGRPQHARGRHRCSARLQRSTEENPQATRRALESGREPGEPVADDHDIRDVSGHGGWRPMEEVRVQGRLKLAGTLIRNTKETPRLENPCFAPSLPSAPSRCSESSH